MKKPIIYKYAIPTRLSDLDTYNHINFKHYLDYVISSRLYFLKERFNLGLSELSKKGVGFYATHVDISYIRPILGMTFVEVESFVDEIIDNTLLKIPFKIFDPISEKAYSTGTITFAIINITTGKQQAISPDLEAILFE
jgi:acyl-CoA thioesterase FadM